MQSTTAIIQEQDVKHDRNEEHVKNLVADVRKLSSSFAKLEPELVISKNITTVLSERRVQMERHLPWANVQYSRIECVGVAGIPSSVHGNQLEYPVYKIFEKLNCNLVKDKLEDFYCLKGDHSIVKFSKRKD